MEGLYGQPKIVPICLQGILNLGYKVIYIYIDVVRYSLIVSTAFTMGGVHLPATERYICKRNIATIEITSPDSLLGTLAGTLQVCHFPCKANFQRSRAQSGLPSPDPIRYICPGYLPHHLCRCPSTMHKRPRLCARTCSSLRNRVGILERL